MTIAGVGNQLQDESVIGAVLSSYDDLPNSEKRIADYILGHRTSVASMTAREIASASGSSAATMSRFVRNLGFSSFAQLRFCVAREDSARESPAIETDGISMSAVASSIDYVLQVKIDELENTAHDLDSHAIARVVRLIQGANMTVFAGVGNTISTAQNAAFKLTQVGYRAMAPNTSDGSTLMSMTLTSHDCLIVLSTSGRSKRLDGVVDGAIDSGTPIVMITDNENTELARHADIVLRTSTHDRLLVNDLRFSQNSMSFVIEVLVSLLFHDSHDAAELARLFDKNLTYDKEAAKE